MNRESEGHHNSKTIDIVFDGSLFSAEVDKKEKKEDRRSRKKRGKAEDGKMWRQKRQKNIMIIVN